MTSEKVRIFLFSLFFVALLVFAFMYQPIDAMSRPADQGAAVMPVGKPLQIKAPLGLPPVPIPADNPLTAETVALGRTLYSTPRFLPTTQFPAHRVMVRRWDSRIRAQFRLVSEGRLERGTLPR